jgi:hypothetical protein
LAKENVPFQSAGLVTSRKFMRSNPHFVENVARAIVEGVAFARNPANKKAVLQSLAKNLRLDKLDILEKSYQRVDGLPRKPCPNLQGVASVLKPLVQHGLNPKASQLKTEDIVDMSLCKSSTQAASWTGSNLSDRVPVVPIVQTVQKVPRPRPGCEFICCRSRKPSVP